MSIDNADRIEAAPRQSRKPWTAAADSEERKKEAAPTAGEREGQQEEDNNTAPNAAERPERKVGFTIEDLMAHAYIHYMVLPNITIVTYAAKSINLD